MLRAMRAAQSGDKQPAAELTAADGPAFGLPAPLLAELQALGTHAMRKFGLLVEHTRSTNEGQTARDLLARPAEQEYRSDKKVLAWMGEMLERFAALGLAERCASDPLRFRPTELGIRAYDTALAELISIRYYPSGPFCLHGRRQHR